MKMTNNEQITPQKLADLLLNTLRSLQLDLDPVDHEIEAYVDSFLAIINERDARIADLERQLAEAERILKLYANQDSWTDSYKTWKWEGYGFVEARLYFTKKKG